MKHLYTLGGLYIVVDTYSGAVHVVDEIAYDIIGLYDEGQTAEAIVPAMLEKYGQREDVTREELEDCCGQIEELKAA